MRYRSTPNFFGGSVVSLSLAGAVLVGLILAACGTSEPKAFTIGVVNLSAGAEAALDGFKGGMDDLGYVEGENATYLYDGPVSGADALEQAARELVEKDVDLVFSLTTPATIAVKRAVEGTDIPVVFVAVWDPVSTGIVDSQIRPGGNLTGIRGGGQMPKTLDWLQQIAPGMTRYFVPYNPQEPASVLALGELGKAAESLGVELLAPEVRTSEELGERLSDLPAGTDAIVVLPGAFFLQNIAQFERTAIEQKLPIASGPTPTGGRSLITYGPDIGIMGAQASRLAAKILEGAAPADLPVETPNFFLGINLRTAAAIGIDIPDDILQQAKEIIR